MFGENFILIPRKIMVWESFLCISVVFGKNCREPPYRSFKYRLNSSRFRCSHVEQFSINNVPTVVQCFMSEHVE